MASWKKPADHIPSLSLSLFPSISLPLSTPLLFTSTSQSHHIAAHCVPLQHSFISSLILSLYLNLYNSLSLFHSLYGVVPSPHFPHPLPYRFSLSLTLYDLPISLYDPPLSSSMTLPIYDPPYLLL